MVLWTTRSATSTFGFTFGSGESARKEGSLHPSGQKIVTYETDRSGAGSGWFGGFAGHNGNSGSGGGSSWILSADAIFPTGNISAQGSFFNETESNPYYFKLSDGYVFSDVKTYPGIWVGNGRLVITILDSLDCQSCLFVSRLQLTYEPLFILILKSK